jgi:hypothetical protein
MITTPHKRDKIRLCFAAMGVCCSHAAVLSDATFGVRLPPAQARDFLANPENWLRIIPGCSDGMAQWEDSEERHFSIQSASGAKKTYSISLHERQKGGQDAVL